jgi:hypothetical protein
MGVDVTWQNRASAKTSEPKVCSQNANLHKPLKDMDMLEKIQLNSETRAK